MKPYTRKVVLSIGDYSGKWSAPWRAAGYQVLQIDPKLQTDVNLGLVGMTAQEFRSSSLFRLVHQRVTGILMAPPCTHFTSSGAQYWPAKDADGRTAGALEIVDACLQIKDWCPNLEWWVLENPVGRLQKLRPELGKPLYVQPYQFAGFADDPESERYTKKTGLWGEFNHALISSPMEPIRACKQGSWIQKLGGSSERTKTLRSMTPTGLAWSFFISNVEYKRYAK